MLGMKFVQVAVLLFVFVTVAIAQDLPKPKLGFVRVSETVNNGVAVKMYEVEVENRDKFDNDLFVPSPALPPCGRNADASRTWLNIYDGDGTRIYGWCAIKFSNELASLKFNIQSAKPQPKTVFIEFIDRSTHQIRRSQTIKLK